MKRDTQMNGNGSYVNLQKLALEKTCEIMASKLIFGGF